MRVALATYGALPELSPDDRLLLPALRARGIRAEPVVWDDAAAKWAEYDAVVVRSCWDYHLHLDRFEAWIARLERLGLPLWNPPQVLRWNARKTYLRDLEAAGIPTVPTRFVEPADPASLDALLEEAGWDDVVVKPIVSASAHQTWRAARGRPGDDERFRRLACTMALMVQPYLPEIASDGEWSLCFFRGEYSHAVRKVPRPGDFRVQADHGGVHRAAEPESPLVSQAAEALRAAGWPTLYARVDGCVIGGVLRLMELELLEPGLFLASHTDAPARLADAIARSLAQE